MFQLLIVLLVAHYMWHLPVATWLWWFVGVICGLQVLVEMGD